MHHYIIVLEYGVKRLKTLPLSLRLTRELHERLMKGVRGGRATPGEFRPSQNWIGHPGCTLNEAAFVPPRAGRLQDLQAEWRVRLQCLKRTTALPLGIVDALLENPTLSATLVARRFEVTHQAAMKALRKLEGLKIVREVTDRRRNQVCLAEEIVKMKRHAH